MQMKWLDGGEQWNEETQSEEEDNRVKQASVSAETVEVSNMKHRGKGDASGRETFCTCSN